MFVPSVDESKILSTKIILSQTSHGFPFDKVQQVKSRIASCLGMGACMSGRRHTVLNVFSGTELKASFMLMFQSLPQGI